MDILKKTVEQLRAVYDQLPTNRKILVVVAVFLTIISLVGLIAWANRVEYKRLYSGLTSEDAGAIIEKLKEKKINYKVGSDGSSILVPSDSLYELRMEMAGEGLPQSSGIGYEIFDDQNIGVTEFVQQVNYRRALQGEIARTIKQLDEIRIARVHLSIPERSLFQDDQEKPSASVVLSMNTGKRLSEMQMQGITHLVANSVEGLEPDNVTIVDSHGNLLVGAKERFQYADMSGTQQQLQNEVEKRLTRKIESMLGNVVGPDKVTARVSVEMDFTQVEQTEENYDPEKAAVRSEQRSSEKSSGKRPAASGIPGVMSNTPDLQPEAAAAAVKTSNYNKSDETINYEITKVTKRIVNQIGGLKRLTAAVLIDGTYVTAENEDGKDVRTYTPRTEEEMSKYESLVRQAVGFDEDRGDSVEVVNVQFHETREAEIGTIERIAEEIDWQKVIIYIIFAALVAMFFVFGLKPLYQLISKTVTELPAAPRGELVEGEEPSSEPSEELPAGVFEVERVGSKQTNLISFAQQNPRLFAQYLKNWLQ